MTATRHIPSMNCIPKLESYWERFRVQSIGNFEVCLYSVEATTPNASDGTPGSPYMILLFGLT